MKKANIPVARQQAIRGVAEDDERRIARLVRDGVVSPGRETLPKSDL